MTHQRSELAEPAATLIPVSLPTGFLGTGCVCCTIRNDWIASRSGWTPYDGMAVTGWPIHTVVRGQLVVRDEQLTGTPQGKTIRFLEAPGKTTVSV